VKLEKTSGSPNYIRIINWFWETVPFLPGYKASHGILFFAILDSINRNKWQNTSIQYNILRNKCRLSKESYLDGRTWLIGQDLIVLDAGKNGYQTAIFNIGIAVENLTAINEIVVEIPTGSNKIEVGKPTGTGRKSDHYSDSSGRNSDRSAVEIPTHYIKHSKLYTVNSKLLNIGFEIFWDLYDKKVGDRKKLETKWSSLTDEERSQVIEHIPKYKEARPDKKYRKDPQGYLNNKVWQDEIISDSSKANENGAHLEDYRNGKTSNGAKLGTSEARTEAAKRWGIG
jgi:hypothetical protein